jgi:hypothetical protein
LFAAVDREAATKKMDREERHRLRREKAAPLVAANRMPKSLGALPGVLPKSKLGEAVGYALGQWERVKAFLEHPEIELSNNLAENSMRRWRWGGRTGSMWKRGGRARGGGDPFGGGELPAGDSGAGSIWVRYCRGWQTGRRPRWGR